MWTRLDSAAFCAAAAAPAEPAIEPTSVVNPKNGFPIPIPTEPVDHAAARFICYLMQAVPQLLPGAEFARDPNSPAQTVPLQAYAGRVFDSDRPLDTSPPYFEASAVVSDNHGVGQVGFGVSPASEPAADAVANCSRSAPSGRVRTARSSQCSRSSRIPATCW